MNFFTFQRFSRDRAVAIFQYKPATPIYHLRQNQFITLPPSRLDFVLRKSHGDCTDLSLQKNSRRDQTLKKLPTGETISFTMRGGRIWVPEACVLYVSQIERSVAIGTRNVVLHRQITFSTRPQVRGLRSNEILHLNRFNYFVRLTQANVPRMSLESYFDGIAVFAASTSLVIPQDYAFQLQRPTEFDIDIIYLVLQPLKCSDLSFLDPFEYYLNQNQIEIKVQSDRLSIQTPVGCELKVIKISRHIKTCRPLKRRTIGIVGKISSDLSIRDRFETNCVKGIENLGLRLHLKSYLPILKRAVFSTVALDVYLIPAHTFFHLHTVQEEEERFRMDILRIALYQIHDDDCELFPTQGVDTRRPFELSVKKHVLNLPIGTQIGFRSNCDLKLREITRIISGSFSRSISIV